MTEARRPRILFAGGGTGGHLYPALALAEAFEQREGGAEVMFVGAKRGVEARVLPQRGVNHRLIRFEPIRRSKIWRNWRLVPAFASILWGVPATVRRFKPDLIIGTGGYASGPVVAWGILRRIPTAVQEQNSVPGLTTRWLASRVRQIHLAFPEALAHLSPGERTEVFELGNPIRPPDPTISRDEARAKFGLGSGPVVLVVGGSQGAQPVTDALLRDLERYTSSDVTPPESGLQILWATGPANYDAIAAELSRLRLSGWVKAVPYINEMPYALAASDLAVSRAGAMALAELCAWGIPSILVPFPFAAANHQLHNARALADAGAAVMLEETELSPGRLWSEMVTLAGDAGRRSQLAERARERGHPNAASKIVEHLSTLIDIREAEA